MVCLRGDVTKRLLRYDMVYQKLFGKSILPKVLTSGSYEEILNGIKKVLVLLYIHDRKIDPLFKDLPDIDEGLLKKCKKVYFIDGYYHIKGHIEEFPFEIKVDLKQEHLDVCHDMFYELEIKEKKLKDIKFGDYFSLRELSMLDYLFMVKNGWKSNVKNRYEKEVFPSDSLFSLCDVLLTDDVIDQIVDRVKKLRNFDYDKVDTRWVKYIDQGLCNHVTVSYEDDKIIQLTISGVHDKWKKVIIQK